MLLLSALILTVVFIFITSSARQMSTADADSRMVMTNKENQIVVEPTKQEIRQKQEVAQKLKDANNLNDVVRNPKNGEIDESKVKDAEEIINNRKIGGAPSANAPVADTDASTETKEMAFDAAKVFKEILNVSPVVIFSKTYCPYSKALKSLLKNQYSISPEPAIVELDKHENGAALQLYIGELSGRKTVPNLFINGVSRGGSDEMHSLHEKNALLDSLVEWGGKTISVDKVNAPSNS